MIVEAKSIAVQSESSEISDLVRSEQISELPVDGRCLYSLTTLTAGASSNMPDFQNPMGVLGSDNSVSFNGQRVSHNLYMVDGGEDYDRGGDGAISVMPSLDAIAEFQLLTSNYGPDYNLSSGGTVSIALKSGTRDYHGSAWEFLRNDALDAGNFFTNATGQPPPELRFHTFGFNAGGPVVLGKKNNKDRNRTFFFFNMEWRKLVQGAVINQTVPLLSEYGGQLNTEIHVPNGNQISEQAQARYFALGLAPGGPFPNNRIPPSLLDRNVQMLLKAGIFPAPNSGSQFIGGNNAGTDVREEIASISRQITEKFWIFGHWIDEQIHNTHSIPPWSHGNVPTGSSILAVPSRSVVLRASYSFSPALLNESSVNYNGNRIDFSPQGIFTRPSGLDIAELFAGNQLDRIPSIELWGATGTRYDLGLIPWTNRGGSYQLRDDVSWIKGRHQIKFGASRLDYRKSQDTGGNTQGGYAFFGGYTGNDFADFLLGYTGYYSEMATRYANHWNNVSWATYVNDNWRVTSRLTLNIGLRWDGIPHTYEVNNQASNFYPSLYDPSLAAVFVPGSAGNAISPDSPGLRSSPSAVLNGLQMYQNGLGVAGQNGIPRGLVKNDWAAFGPRLGFAYDLTGHGSTVLRGGFSIAYERVMGNDIYNAGANVPFNSNVSFGGVSFSNPRESLLTGEALSYPLAPADVTGLAYRDYKPPASYQFSIGVQRSLGQHSVVSIAYVGNQNRHQSDVRDINIPAPAELPALIQGTAGYNTVLPYSGFRSIALAENAQNSHYNSLQVNLRAQLRKFLSLQFAYTLSRSIDPGQSYDLLQVSNPYDRGYDLGPSQFDRTHIVTANFVYHLPTWRGAGLTKALLGGWEASGIVTAESGLPLRINLAGPQWSNGLASGANRPDWNGSINYPQSMTEWFDPGAFSSPVPGQWGNLPSGALRAPGRYNWNVALFKSFTLSEWHNTRLEFRVESYNTLNHTQFHNINNYASFGADGKTLQNNFGAVTSVWDPRVFQLAVKLMF